MLKQEKKKTIGHKFMNIKHIDFINRKMNKYPSSLWEKNIEFKDYIPAFEWYESLLSLNLKDIELMKKD